MKKILCLFMLIALVLVTACNDTQEENSDAMKYEEFVAAELGSEVKIETYIQAKQSWWSDDLGGKASFYTMDHDGGYFLYNMACTEEEYNSLTIGTKILVTGTKSEWAGETEITDATFTKKSGTYIATAKDLTNSFGTDDLANYKNQLVKFSEVTVTANTQGTAFLYKWNGSGSRGDDLYFNVTLNGVTLTFTVESYLCDENSDVYKAVENLKVGDIIDLEGFMYWYEGPQAHVTSITTKATDVLTYAGYATTDADNEVTIETYIQAKQSWWSDELGGKASFYTMDQDGGYFLYNMACTEEEYNALTIGTRILVTGTKSVWAGEIEIINATYTVLKGNYIADALDITNLMGTEEEVVNYQNQLVSIKGLTVEASSNGEAFLYKWNGSGSRGDDLYFNVSLNGTTYTFTVESYLCDENSDVYKMVESLQVGDVIDITGFLYWYEGAQPHVTIVAKAN